MQTIRFGGFLSFAFNAEFQQSTAPRESEELVKLRARAIIILSGAAEQRLFV